MLRELSAASLMRVCALMLLVGLGGPGLVRAQGNPGTHGRNATPDYDRVSLLESPDVVEIQ